MLDDAPPIKHFRDFETLLKAADRDTMSGFDPSSIDWTDPVEANRQLKLQLAALEAQQGLPLSTTFGGDEPQNDHSLSNYSDEPQYVSRADYDPQYDDNEPEEDYYSSTTAPSAEALRASQQYNQGHRDYYDSELPPQQRQPQQKRTGKTKSTGRLSRTGSRNEGQIKRNKRRDNMTFSGNKCRDIDRGNIALLSRLSTIHTNGGGNVPKLVRKTKKKGSNSINMRKKQNKIAEENRKFALRLQRVRGTGSMSKKTMRKHAQRTAKFAELGREVRPVLSKRQKARRDREVRQEREGGWQ